MINSTYFIGITVPNPLAALIDTWRAKYYPNGLKIVKPHITIKSPFNASRQPKDIVKIVTQYVKLSEILKIEVDGFGTFGYQPEVFFAKVIPSVNLVQMRQAIVLASPKYADINSSRPDHVPYRPHITIVNHMSLDQWNDIRDKFCSVRLHESFNATAIYLYQKDEHGIYQIVGEVA
jgi:2'-5' RNA ligase